ncbi:MAG: hypothetical protein ACOC5T_09205 [Elusimicrobiota bacterium]
MEIKRKIRKEDLEIEDMEKIKSISRANVFRDRIELVFEVEDD